MVGVNTSREGLDKQGNGGIESFKLYLEKIYPKRKYKIHDYHIAQHMIGSVNPERSRESCYCIKRVGTTM